MPDAGLHDNWALATKIVVGLGNPGKEYTWTRHNLGFRALDAFLKAQEIPKRFEPLAKSRAQTISVDGVRVLLVRPGTYMNLSGDAVAPLLEKTGLDLANVLVVHDEMDLPAGRAKMRLGGGAAGHGGVQSIIDRCGEGFARLKIGIGAPPDPEGESGADWVLSELSPEEEAFVAAILPTVAEGIRLWIVEGAEKAMTWFNTAMKEGFEDETDIPDERREDLGQIIDA